MPLIWCAISGHGYGHAAQIVPVLHELGKRIPRLIAVFRTPVPSKFFEERMRISWEVSPAQQDVGCVQQGPLEIDALETWAATGRFHENWEAKVDAEARVIQARKPACVLSDISYLAIEAGKAAGKPTIALCNLSWDRVLSLLADPGDTQHNRIITAIAGSYALADLLIRPAPSLTMPAFREVRDVGPLLNPTPADRFTLAAAIQAPQEDQLVLVGFGGIQQERLPFEALEQMAGYRFLVSGPVPQGCRRCFSNFTLGFPFPFILASCDLYVTKPGYNMVVEAVALGKPVVYVRRYNFADEQSLVDYLHRHGRALELKRADFESGAWAESLALVRQLSSPSAPPPAASGAGEAADILAACLTGARL